MYQRWYHSVMSRGLFLLLFVAAACKGPPLQLVVGFGDTVVVHNVVPIQLSTQVLDAAGHVLPNAGVRFEWTSEADVPLTERGVVTCTHAIDATLRASLGALSKSVVVRCRPVHDLFGGGPVNLVLGDPPYDLWFEAVDATGRPVRLWTAVLTVDDTTIVTREGWRIRARSPGVTGVNLYVGDSWTNWYVQVFQPVLTLDSIRPGQHLAVPVRLAAGEQRSWHIPSSRENFGVHVLPAGDTLRVPRLEIVGGYCIDKTLWSQWCTAWHGAAVIVYHPRSADPAREWSGTVTVAH